jgi:hypothetical protein
MVKMSRLFILGRNASGAVVSEIDFNIAVYDNYSVVENPEITLEANP